MATDTEVILLALQKERDELHEKIMQVDRIIKRVKSLEYSRNDKDIEQPQIQEESGANQPTQQNKIFLRKSDIKVQILRVFDILGKAAALGELQAEFNKIAGTTFSIKDPVRAMKSLGLVKVIKRKGSERGFAWVKAEWVVNGQLDEKYKPEGFDLLYKAEDLIFE